MSTASAPCSCHRWLPEAAQAAGGLLACMQPCSLISSVLVSHFTDVLLCHVACTARVCGVRACRFSVAAVREVCIRSWTCPRHPQSDEDVLMAKELGDLPWVPMGAVGPAGLQGPQAGQQMSPRSPRLAIALQ